jgi:3-hydroxyisobutyrate dehydrogenase-like beta-hydroxyacid dehydrogenase
VSQRGWLKLGFRFLGLILAKSTTGKGIVIAEGVADVARRASRLICLVDTSAQVERVVSDVASVAGGGDIFICMSTVALVTIQKSCDELFGWV